MIWSFRGLGSGRRPGRILPPVRKSQRGRFPALMVEPLESRVLLASGLFLQGTAFVDADGNSRLDPSDTHLGGTNPPATIQLFQGSKLIGQTTTDANGSYRFDDSHGVYSHNLLPGTYRLVEIAPPGFLSSGVQTDDSPLAPASALGPNTIQVMLPDLSRITVTFDSAAFVQLGLNESVNLPVQRAFLNGKPLVGNDGQVPLSLRVGGATPFSVDILSLCTDPTQHLVLGTNIFQAAPGSVPVNSLGLPAHNAGRIAYLYNHFGTTPLPDADHAVALQVAIRELEFDQTPDLSSGVYQFLHDSSPVTALAKGYLAASAGKSEEAVFLNAVSPSQQGGLQSMIAPESLNFANIPAPELSLQKSADQATIRAGDQAGFGITIHNGGQAAATDLTLSDPLPAGSGQDVRWQIDTGTGDPGAFQITGPVGAQVLTLNSGVTALAAGASLTVHLTALTTTADIGILANTATLHAGNGAPAQQNEHSSASITIFAGAPIPESVGAAGQAPGTPAPAVGGGLSSAPPFLAPEVAVPTPEQLPEVASSSAPPFLAPEGVAPTPEQLPEVAGPSAEGPQGVPGLAPATASPLVAVFPGNSLPAGNLAFVGKVQLISSNFLGDGTENLAAASAFVTGLYRNVLDRDPDVGSLTAWVQGLLLGTLSRQQVATALWQSAEHRLLEVDSFYAAFLHRAADPFGQTLWVSALLAGVSEQDVILALLTSPEYLAGHPSDDAFVNGLYADVLGRLPTAGEEAGALAALRGGALSGGELALALVASPEAEVRAIDAYYAAFFQRTDAPEEELVLLGSLQSGRQSLETIGEMLLASDEYYDRGILAPRS